MDRVSPIPPSIEGKNPGAFLAIDGWKASGAVFSGEVNCELNVTKPGRMNVSKLPEGITLYLDNTPVNGDMEISQGSYKLSFGVLPKQFALYQNAPNPFNPTTSIAFDIPNKAVVQLEVYDLLGRRVEMLVNEEMDAGSYRAIWDGRDESGREVPSGVYFYRIKAGDNVANRHMLLIK